MKNKTRLTWLWTIQGRLTLFSLFIALVPIVLIGILVFRQARANIYAQMGQIVQQVAVSTSGEVQRFLADRQGDIESITASQTLASGTIEQKLERLRSFKTAYPIYKALQLTDEKGQVVASTTWTKDNLADETWFREAIKNKDMVFISDVYYLASLRSVVVTFADALVSSNGQIIGVAAAHLDAQVLFDTVGDNKVGERGSVFLVNRAGQIVSDKDVARIFEDVSDLPSVQAVLWGETGTLTALDPDTKEETLYGYAPMGQQWAVVVKLPTEELDEPIRQLANQIWLVGLACALVTSGLVFVASQVLVRPILGLTKVAERLGAGDYGMAIPDYGNNEIGQLGDSLKGMVTAIQQRDSQVKEYAANLEKEMAERKHAEAEREQLQQQILTTQQQLIRELSTPIIPLMDGIIVMPLIGFIDSERAKDIMRALLAGISQHRAKIVLIDITGVSVMDTAVANYLYKTIEAARLKGAQTIVTGISESVAETIVDLGIEFRNVLTLRDLQTGLKVALDRMNSGL